LQLAHPHDDGLVLSDSAAIGVRVLGKLERGFAGRTFVATDDFTVADILMAHVLRSCIHDQALLAPYPGVAAYRDRCLARPAFTQVRAT